MNQYNLGNSFATKHLKILTMIEQILFSIHSWAYRKVKEIPKARNVEQTENQTGKYGLPLWLRGKESARSAEDTDLILGLGRSPGEGNDNSL